MKRLFTLVITVLLSAAIIPLVENYHPYPLYNFINRNDLAIREFNNSFQNSIDADKYYGGSYWEKYRHVLVICVTDPSVIPAKNNPNVFYKTVKYSYKQLMDFQEILVNNYKKYHPDVDLGLAISVKTNKVVLFNTNRIDTAILNELVPSDSYELFNKSGNAIMVTNN